MRLSMNIFFTNAQTILNVRRVFLNTSLLPPANEQSSEVNSANIDGLTLGKKETGIMYINNLHRMRRFLWVTR